MTFSRQHLDARAAVTVYLHSETCESYHFAGDSISTCNNLRGSRLPDSIGGLAGNDRINGRAGDDVLSGGAGGDVLRGGAGDDRLSGGRESDTLVGGAGRDRFVFDAPLGGTDVDRITDVDVSADRLLLDRAVFTELKLGTLAASAFTVGRMAADPNDRIVYDDRTGALLYDSDGSGGRSAITFARLDPGLALNAGDFLVT